MYRVWNPANGHTNLETDDVIDALALAQSLNAGTPLTRDWNELVRYDSADFCVQVCWAPGDADATLWPTLYHAAEADVKEQRGLVLTWARCPCCGEKRVTNVSANGR